MALCGSKQWWIFNLLFRYNHCFLLQVNCFQIVFPLHFKNTWTRWGIYLALHKRCFCCCLAKMFLIKENLNKSHYLMSSCEAARKQLIRKIVAHLFHLKETSLFFTAIFIQKNEYRIHFSKDRKMQKKYKFYTHNLHHFSWTFE